ncbi:hypothetical protein BDF22DRAFT_744701 [Syncephalis plumigaleata]|nr:hypothetical protein BDF22DRAFT_744701 [Syncephalis plumigaleata]
MSKHMPLSPTSSVSVHSQHSTCAEEHETRRLTAEELTVLQHTSLINGLVHLPWVSNDVYEPFELDDRYNDPMGLLKLSSRQKERYHQWLRPSQFLRNPIMIKRVSSKQISQEVLTNCSFVASLCVCADYEQRFKKRLITRCIYPQDRRGRPYYNPWGKYMIKLLLNGIHRKNHPLVVTTTEQELWPMLIEKAYLKAQGGYDFPGSNSGIDMHALTGWIPDHVLLQESEQASDMTWHRLYAGLNSGKAVGTLATGQVDIIDQDWLWLVPTHAYAILQAVELPSDIRDDGGDTRMLRCKNPWRQHGWQGQDGPDDVIHWHPRLRRVLSAYKTGDAAADGEFWIGWSAVCRYFDTLHLSWDPDQFHYRFTRHAEWPITIGPPFDRHCFAWNPQYSIRVNASNDSGSNGETQATVWLLLSRHIESIEADNRDYMTMHVYATQSGERVFYPVEPTAVKGIYVNNPHVLVKLWPAPGEQYYTVVLSQQERSKPLYYTLNVYANIPFLFRETPGFAYSCQITDAWTMETAGGNNSYASWIDNPQYRLCIQRTACVHVLLDLFDVAEHRSDSNDPATMVAAKIDLFMGDTRIDRSQYRYLVAHSGDYRAGLTYTSASLDPGVYVLLLSTFDKGTPSSFKLTITSNQPGVQVIKL